MGALTREVSHMDGATTRQVDVYQLGRQPYLPVWQAMRARMVGCQHHQPDAVWLVEHEPIYTLGQAGRSEHVLDPGAVPVIRVDRGGQVTYHGPGQLVVYPLLNLRRLGLGLRDYVTGMEEAIILTLAHWGIYGCRKRGAPGVYVDQAKIAAIGLRIKQHCTFHGLSLNVCPDLAPFTRINPCGYAGLAVTSLHQLGVKVRLEALTPIFLQFFAEQFALRLLPARAPLSRILSGCDSTDE